MQILIVILGIVLALLSIGMSCFFNWKANKLAINLSNFIIREITGRDISPYFGKDGKLHKHVNEQVQISEKVNYIVKGEKGIKKG